MNHIKLKTMDRKLWFSISFISLLLLSTSLYLQNYHDIKPNILSIYERCALIGLFFSGVIGILAPKTILRYFALILWAISAEEGLWFSWKHTMLNINNHYNNICSLYLSFPKWLPLDKWLPELFKPINNCIEKQYNILILDISQWLIIFFVTLISFFIIFFTSQFYSNRKIYYI